MARENADNQRETLQLVEVRLSAGRGTDFDTSRARAQLESTLARVPALEAAVAVTQHRLAVLTGNAPGALISELDAPASLPTLPDRLDPGTPGELLRRRPDVIAAEERLHAATARIGVATADLFPRFTLAGLIGTQAFDSSALFERDSETRLVALGVDWSFLDVGRVRARIAATDANASGALAGYEQAVLLALEDTENALVRVRARAHRGPASRTCRHGQRPRGATRTGAFRRRGDRPARRAGCRAHAAFVTGRLRRRAHAHRDGARRAVPGAGGRVADPRSGARAGECAVKIAALMVVAWLAAATAEAGDRGWQPDAVFSQMGAGTATDSWSVGAQWHWRRAWLIRDSLLLRGRWEFAVGRWRADEDACGR